jgi:hypothetical protein
MGILKTVAGWLLKAYQASPRFMAIIAALCGALLLLPSRFLPFALAPLVATYRPWIGLVFLFCLGVTISYLVTAGWSLVASKRKEAKPNIRLIEIKTTEGSISQAKFLGVPLAATQPFPTILACFRNHSKGNRIPKQPHVNAHIIYRDARNEEITDLCHGVWIGERDDYTTLNVGEKKCLVLMSLTSGKLSKWRQEEYHTDTSWMADRPPFRAHYEEIDGLPRRIIIELLDPGNGKRIKRFVLTAKSCSKGSLPLLEIESAFWSLLRRD